jgi:hypothetical protein
VAKLKHIANIFGTNMGLAHDGLYEYAKTKAQLRGWKPEKNHVLVFINNQQDRVKILTGIDENHPHGVVGYYRNRGKIDREAIQYIVECFDGKRIDFDKATEKVFEKKLSKEVMRLKKAAKQEEKKASKEKASENEE